MKYIANCKIEVGEALIVGENVRIAEEPTRIPQKQEGSAIQYFRLSQITFPLQEAKEFAITVGAPMACTNDGEPYESYGMGVIKDSDGPPHFSLERALYSAAICQMEEDSKIGELIVRRMPTIDEQTLDSGEKATIVSMRYHVRETGN